MSGKQRKYSILYLPAGKIVEVQGPPHPNPKGVTHLVWHIVSKNRADLKIFLNRILRGGFPVTFYRRNEMPDWNPKNPLKSCHFVFQRSTIINPTESE